MGPGINYEMSVSILGCLETKVTKVKTGEEFSMQKVIV